MAFSLRPLEEADIPRVLDLERESFPTFWTRTPFKRDLNNRRISYLVATQPSDSQEPEKPIPPENLIASPLEEYLLMRLVRGLKHRIFPPAESSAPPRDTPLGFVSVWLLSDEAHLTAIAVIEEWRGHGIGEVLLIGAIKTAILRKSRVVTLEVRMSNYKAISLYEKYGFRKVGIRKGYYTDNRENAAIMTTEPIHSLSYQRRFAELREAYNERHGSVEMTLRMASA